MDRERSVATTGAPDAFADRLRHLREAAGLSQEELAQRARISTDAVSALERGTRTHPYPSTVRSLADALALDPAERARLIASLPTRGGRSEQQSPPERQAVRSPLPRPPTSLLGRDDDLITLAALLTDRPLVTLTGPGGVGKSRLGTAVAERVATRLRDGVAWVALAPVIDESLVLPAIGQALGEIGAGAGAPDVLAALAELQLLLVVDNLEHLRGAPLIIADVLAHCPGVRVLATSRAPLRIRGETEFPVTPLALPESGVTDPQTLRASPAAALLLERGRAVRPGLVFTERDAAAVVQICQRLAGLPLALELAAVGLRSLTPAELLDNLEEVLDVAGPVDLPARQHTMRATLDWSYGLLREQERTALRRLSVFTGGFTVSAARAVLEASDVVASIDRLVTQSLLVAHPQQDGHTRYELLGPVARYARSLLTPDEALDVGQRHCRHFLEIAERADLHRQQGQRERLHHLSAEDGNIGAAVDWAVRHDHHALAARFSWALWRYWWLRGQVVPARRLVEEILAADLPDAARSHALVAATALAEPDVGTTLVRERCLEALELARRADDVEVEAAARTRLGLLALEQNDPASAENHFRDGAEAGGRASGAGAWFAAACLVFLGAARRHRHDDLGAAEAARAGLSAAEQEGDRTLVTVALYNLAQAERALGRDASARTHLAEAVVTARDLGDAANLSYLLDAMAMLDSAEGDHGRAATLLGAAANLRKVIGTAVYGYYAPDLVARDAAVEVSRSALGVDRFDAEHRAGAVLDIEAAAALALHGHDAGQADGVDAGSPGGGEHDRDSLTP
ncbi:ATP-binding protein [Georgenia subflava]|uniref:Helix-turn-helix domain-containing protein n=1 Tax=Georgenia subflava TaxID=1622177 RepID=A0A6N7EC02_9MICO|nr:helix-turn-helix domain-containing protein [Georgenia subflava]MPV35639.1 helix-turn-helix domain-containing protein [Georgenia subflava]